MSKVEKLSLRIHLYMPNSNGDVTFKNLFMSFVSIKDLNMDLFDLNRSRKFANELKDEERLKCPTFVKC